MAHGDVLDQRGCQFRLGKKRLVGRWAKEPGPSHTQNEYNPRETKTCSVAQFLLLMASLFITRTCTVYLAFLSMGHMALASTVAHGLQEVPKFLSDC